MTKFKSADSARIARLLRSQGYSLTLTREHERQLQGWEPFTNAPWVTSASEQEVRLAAAGLGVEGLEIVVPTPLTPSIFLEDRRSLTVCNTCGVEDGTVRTLAFRWTENNRAGAHLSGGTGVALCCSCRTLTRNALL